MVPDSKSTEYYGQVNKITKSICDFFQHKGVFLSEDRGFASYYSVRGKDCREIPENTLVSIRAWPVYNEKAKDIASSVYACEKLGRKLFSLSKSQEIRVLSRDFMIEGSTLPIRVTYEIFSREQEERAPLIDRIYVKQMNLNRIFLGVLYHIAAGRDYGMHFSETSIVERETKGISLDEAYLKNRIFLKDSKIKRELVKLSILTHFLSLDDMDNGTNTIVKPNKDFDVIDFDKGFWYRIPDFREELVNPFYYETNGSGEKKIEQVSYDKLIRHFSKKELESVVLEEQEKIHSNIKNNQDSFHSIIELMSTIKYYNLAVNELYGEKDIISYFLKRYFELKPRKSF